LHKPLNLKFLKIKNIFMQKILIAFTIKNSILPFASRQLIFYYNTNLFSCINQKFILQTLYVYVIDDASDPSE
jgi:hypothetical protein